MLEKTTSHKIIILAGTVASGFSLATLVTVIDPNSASNLVLSSFYVSLFLFITGLLTLVGLTLRSKYSQGLYLTSLGVSLRQAALLALLVVLTLILLSNNLLHWWVSLILLTFFIFLEIFFNLN
jgi:hypothetical protein